MRKIIDKLAMFVAKNGPEFEAMTKAKQEGNPRFAFLTVNGPFYNYYQGRVATEQAILRAKGPDSGSNPGSSPLAALEAKIGESERNLKAQWDALLQQQEAQIATAIAKVPPPLLPWRQDWDTGLVIRRGRIRWSGWRGMRTCAWASSGPSWTRSQPPARRRPSRAARTGSSPTPPAIRRRR